MRKNRPTVADLRAMKGKKQLTMLRVLPAPVELRRDAIEKRVHGIRLVPETEQPHCGELLERHVIR